MIGFFFWFFYDRLDWIGKEERIFFWLVGPVKSSDFRDISDLLGFQ